ncbi:MAG: NAD-dependent epimerase/dehydratase family protein [bacterium]|nr:NAD-dependent epimerase/dehydratase family protein [bacterium]
MNKNVLVTGASGFIGSHLCEELIRKNYAVFALTRSQGGGNLRFLPASKRLHVRKGSITDFNFLNKVIKTNKIGAVFHLAAALPNAADLEDPLPGFISNAEGTLQVLRAAAANRVKKFIYASTMSVYAEPPSRLPVREEHPLAPSTIYSVGKLAGELLCNAYASRMQITVLRYGGAYGPHQPDTKVIPRFVTQARAGQQLTILGSGRQTTDFVYVGDIVNGTIRALLKNRPGTYNLGGGKEHSVREVADLIIAMTGSRSSVASSGKGADRPFKFFLDITKARRNLGYSPRSFEQGLRQYLRYLDTKKK